MLFLAWWICKVSCCEWFSIGVRSTDQRSVDEVWHQTLGKEMVDGESGQDPKADGLAQGDLNGQKAPLMLPKIIKFTELARCGDEIWIECEAQLYRLRKTKQGKLILTK